MTNKELATKCTAWAKEYRELAENTTDKAQRAHYHYRARYYTQKAELARAAAASEEA